MTHSFTCPTCGSHKYGSSGCTGPTTQMTGHCHGYIRQPDGSQRVCSYSWPRTKDAELHPGLLPPPESGTSQGRVV